jgi:hypothetical protein
LEDALVAPGPPAEICRSVKMKGNSLPQSENRTPSISSRHEGCGLVLGVFDVHCGGMESGGARRPRRACRRERCRRLSRLSWAGYTRRSWSDVPAVEICGFQEEKRIVAGGEG